MQDAVIDAVIEAPPTRPGGPALATRPAPSACTRATTSPSWSTPSACPPAPCSPDGLTLVEFVPQGHKVALAASPRAARSGATARSSASRRSDIRRAAPGSRNRASRPRPRPTLDALEMATRVPAPLPPLEGYTFEGFRNPDGSVGTKNILAISTSVQCVAGTLDFAIKRIKAELLPRYPNVDDVVGAHPRLWLRRRHQRARGGDPDPHAAEPRPQPEFRRRGDGRRPRLREARLRAPAAGRRRGRDGGVVRLQDERHDGLRR